MRGMRCLVVLGLCCAGCPNPNTFTTPRTVAPGKVSHTISAEAIGAHADNDTAVLPVPPSYTARIGLADRFELGIHAAHMTSLALDLKWNPLRSENFDLALDPGGQIFFAAGDAGSVTVYYLHAPLLLGFNASPNFSVVVTPGISMIGASATTDSITTGTASDSALLARAGIGFDIRTNIKFAIHPEITFLVPTEGEGYIFLAGVGFNFGALPDFGQSVEE